MNIEPFEGGRRQLWIACAAGILGLLATALLAPGSPQQALHSYWLAFVYWVGIAVGALILLSSFHAASARWMVVLRRPIEAMGSASPVFALLFLPVAIWPNLVFPWVEEPGNKGAYLNLPFFLVRAAIYFGVWGSVGLLLHRWSVAQDQSGDPALTLRQRRLGAAALPLLGLTLTFASFDWLMSLKPDWGSTIFGVYYFSGSFLAAIAVLTLSCALAQGDGLFGAFVTTDHLHNLGKLLLAFTAFWAYIAFSQYLLIWIGNLPEETGWYLDRQRGGWGLAGIGLILIQFSLPFFALLSKRINRRRGPLVLVSLWLLVAHYLDLYWMVIPASGRPSPGPRLTDLSAWLGVGGVAVAFGLWRHRGRLSVPAKDPFLPDSLAYRQP